jgi:hypothetical protein
LGLAEGEGYTSVMARKERREAKLGHDIVNKRWRKLLWFYMPRLIGTGRPKKHPVRAMVEFKNDD